MPLAIYQKFNPQEFPMRYAFIFILSLPCCELLPADEIPPGWDRAVIDLEKGVGDDVRIRINGKALTFPKEGSAVADPIRQELMSIYRNAEKSDENDQSGKIYPKVILELRCMDDVPYQFLRRVIVDATVITQGVGDQSVFKHFCITIGRHGTPVGGAEETALNAEIHYGGR